MDKITVGIFFGGISTEHEVSRRSAVYIIESMDENKYDFMLFEITKRGELLQYAKPESDLEAFCVQIVNIDNNLEKNKISLSEDIFSKNSIDVAFPVIHGTGGEDGVLQGFLEMCEIPYVGSNVISSAVAFDKAVAKKIFKWHGIRQAKYISLASERLEAGMDDVCNEAESGLGYPVFVKPSNGGSSVGIYKAHDRRELKSALVQASKYDRKLLIEESIDGMELECAVFGGYDSARALGVGEVVSCNEFYDYKAKYIEEGSKTIIPARINSGTTAKVMEIAVEAFNAVNGYGLARVDFFLKENSEIYLNEINTMPGFTSISMYPKLWENGGGDKERLITQLIELAFERKRKYSFLKDLNEEAKDE